MDKEKMTWFLVGVASVYVYHKFVKPIPGKNQTAA